MSLFAASEADTAVFPDQIKEKGQTLLLNGIGLRKMTVFKVKVYTAALYLEKRMSDEKQILDSNQKKKIELVFLRDVKAKDIVESWERGFNGNCTENCDQMRTVLNQLNQAMIDVKKGQKVSMFFEPRGFELSTPMKAPAFFEGKDFAKVILSTFIGRKPPSSEVKDGLLGKLSPIPIVRSLSSIPGQ